MFLIFEDQGYFLFTLKLGISLACEKDWIINKVLAFTDQ